MGEFNKIHERELTVACPDGIRNHGNFARARKEALVQSQVEGRRGPGRLMQPAASDI